VGNKSTVELLPPDLYAVCCTHGQNISVLFTLRVRFGCRSRVANPWDMPMSVEQRGH